MATIDDLIAGINNILASMSNFPDLGAWGTPSDYSVLCRQDQPAGSGSSQYKVEDVPMAAETLLARAGGGDIGGTKISELMEEVSPATGDWLLAEESGGLLRKVNIGNLPSGGGSGDVVGPASATDEALARFDATTGKLLQSSVATLSDTGALSGLTKLTVDSLTLDSNIIKSSVGLAFKPALGNTVFFKTGSDTIALTLSLVNLTAAQTMVLPNARVDLTPLPAAVLTGSRAVQLDAGGVMEAAATTATELGYVNGVTSAIQTQMDGKANVNVQTVSRPFFQTDPVADTAYPICTIPKAATITRVTHIVTGATSVTFNIEKRAEDTPFTAGTDIFTSDKTATTTIAHETTINSASVTARQSLWYAPTSKSGTPTAIWIVVEYTVDA